MDDLLKWFAANKDAAPFVASLSAIAAVVVSPVVQRWIALRQQRATVVSSNRVRWIEEFRREVAEICEAAHTIVYLQVEIVLCDEKGKNELRAGLIQKAFDHVQRANVLLHTLALKLSDDRADEKEIINLLNRLVPADLATSNNYPGLRKEVLSVISQLTYRVRVFLKREWRKVEKLK